MKRLLVILAVTLSLGGCANLKAIGDIANIATTSIEQPVTRKMYRNVENSLILAAVGLNIYKNKCEAGTIAQSCYQVVEQLQVYTTRAKPVLANLRVFVRRNDQVNARVAYNTITDLLASIRNTAAINGVK